MSGPRTRSYRDRTGPGGRRPRKESRSLREDHMSVLADVTRHVAGRRRDEEGA